MNFENPWFACLVLFGHVFCQRASAQSLLRWDNMLKVVVFGGSGKVNPVRISLGFVIVWGRTKKEPSK